MPSQLQLIFLYIALVFIWATTPLAIVWSVEDIYPLWAMVLRFLCTIPFLVAIVIIFRIPLPLDKQSCLSYLVGSGSLIVSQIFTYLATGYLSSSLIALMFGLAPVIAGLIGFIWFSVRLSITQWIGLFVALSGLSLVCLMAQSSRNFELIGVFLVLISVIIYCFSIYGVKKINAQISPYSQAVGSIGCSILLAMMIAPFISADLPEHLPSMKSMLALLFTVMMSSIVAMFCYFKLVQNLSATTISLTTVLTPIIALYVGVTINQEQLEWPVYVGIGVIFFGMILYFYKDVQRMLMNRR